MAKRLFDNLSSDYLAAASRLQPKSARRKVVAYVESFDDILFWRYLLSEIETPEMYFEVMLPSRSTLGKGKKVALMNALNDGLGPSLIACVDADYDYLIQGVTETSQMICRHPWVFHTMAYAIENYQCYAESLHTVCVMATLNDKRIFDFEKFLADYSRLVFPLFVWSIWCYRYNRYKEFNIQNFIFVTHLENVNLSRPDRMLELVKKRVNSKIGWLQHSFPEARKHLKDVEADILRLGVTPETTYLFMRGHDVFEKIVTPLVTTVCRILTNERESQIRRLATHSTQMHNELSGYEHASASVVEMMRKQVDYKRSALYQNLVDSIKSKFEH